MTQSSATAAGTGDRVLRQRMQAFLEGWRSGLGKQWQAAKASALYEELEQLSAMAEEQGAGEIAGPALELAVYLCSFVDRDTAPNPSQRQGLDARARRALALNQHPGQDPVLTLAAPPPHDLAAGASVNLVTHLADPNLLVHRPRPEDQSSRGHSVDLDLQTLDLLPPALGQDQ